MRVPTIINLAVKMNFRADYFVSQKLHTGLDNDFIKHHGISSRMFVTNIQGLDIIDIYKKLLLVLGQNTDAMNDCYLKSHLLTGSQGGGGGILKSLLPIQCYKAMNTLYILLNTGAHFFAKSALKKGIVSNDEIDNISECPLKCGCHEDCLHYTQC